MSNVKEVVEPVGYSNLRRPKLPGFYGASAVQAVVIVALALPGAVLVTFTLLWGGIYFLVSAAIVVPWVVGTLLGRNPYEAMWRRYLWSRAVRRGQTVLSQGLLGFTPDGQTRLPGLAAQTELYSCEDVFGRPFGLLVTPSPKHYTVVISCQPPGVSGIDQKQIDNQAAHWGSWLGQLGGEPDLVGAQVVIETAPDTGHKLRAMALGSIEDDAPDSVAGGAGRRRGSCAAFLSAGHDASDADVHSETPRRQGRHHRHDGRGHRHEAAYPAGPLEADRRWVCGPRLHSPGHHRPCTGGVRSERGHRSWTRPARRAAPACHGRRPAHSRRTPSMTTTCMTARSRSATC